MTPKIHAYIVKALRRVWGWSPEKHEARKRREWSLKKGHYLCEGCDGIFARKDTAVDHISPVILPEQGFIDWNTYVERLFCPSGNLQVLCKANCHASKTKSESSERKLGRKSRKGAI